MKNTEKQYKLSVVWKTLDPSKKLIWGDNSECYIIRKVKIERWRHKGDWVYEMYKTDSDLYEPIDYELVDYAYDNSIYELSDAIALYKIEKRVLSVENEITDYSAKTKEELITKYKSLKSKVKFNLNQFYEDNYTRGCRNNIQQSFTDA